MLDRLRRLKAEKPRLYQLGVYIVYGVLTTLVNWITYEILKAALGLKAHDPGSAAYKVIVNVCQWVAWLASVLFAYFTNRRFVFKSDTTLRAFWREMGQFISSRVLGFLLFDQLFFNIFLLFMSDRPAKLIMNVLVIIYNYLASRFVVFKKPKPKTGKESIEEETP